ncbi:MAG: hypothetical protein OQK73_11020 [Gammaproteobacteria bacterium]|nr:hypothetical protein [Gammaproteobacteria bacterium]
MFGDTDFKKQRNLLIVVSIFISVFVLGEGSLVDDGSFLGGSIIFGKPYILKLAVTLIFYYLLFRYLLYSSRIFGRYTHNFKYILYSDKDYQKAATKWLHKISSGDDKHINTEDRDLLINNKIWTKNPKAPLLPPLIGNLLFPDMFYVNHCPDKTIKAHDSGFTGNTEHEFWERIPTYPPPFLSNIPTKKNAKKCHYISGVAPIFSMYSIELKCLFKSFVLYKAFTDFIFPLILAVYTAILISHNYFAEFFNTLYYWIVW